MTLKQLTYFLKIAETCNLTRAAQILHMSQPPLSYQLKLLEDELGVKLFIRGVHNMHITNEGVYLQEKATQILSLHDKTVDEIKKISTTGNVDISIGTVTSVNHNLLPRIVNIYKQKYPNAVFNIYDGSSFRIMELLNNNVIDFGILREPFNKDLYAHMQIRLFSNPDDDYFVAAGNSDSFQNIQEDTITVHDLARHNLILHRRFEDIFMTICGSAGVSPHIVCRNDNIMSSIEWAIGNMGVAIMPFTSSLLIERGQLLIKKIIEPSFHSNLYLIWNNNAKLLPPAQDFIQLLKNYVPKE
jgi:DNA-binding transcriptional LysR family regulator